MEIRNASLEDAPIIEDIYAHYVRSSTCTWQEIPGTLVERRVWLAEHGERHPVIVAEEGGEVVAWGSLSPFHRRSGYRFTVEDSVYVRAGRHRRGLGRAILGELVARARALEYRTLVASITAEQEASIRLHRAFGFVETARMPEIGFKLDRWHDLVYLQLPLH